MKALLEDINADVHDAGNCLKKEEAQQHRIYYQDILKKADIECPLPDEIRFATNKAWVLGNDRFKDMLEEKLKRSVNSKARRE